MILELKFEEKEHTREDFDVKRMFTLLCFTLKESVSGKFILVTRAISVVFVFTNWVKNVD